MEAQRPTVGFFVNPRAQVLLTFSLITGRFERRCAPGTPLRRCRKELTCRQER